MLPFTDAAISKHLQTHYFRIQQQASSVFCNNCERQSEFLTQSVFGFSDIFPREVPPCSVSKKTTSLISRSASHQPYEKLPTYYYYYTAFSQKLQLWQVCNSKRSCWCVLKEMFKQMLWSISGVQVLVSAGLQHLVEGEKCHRGTSNNSGTNHSEHRLPGRRSFRNILGHLS